MTWDNLLFYKHRHIKILVLEVSHIKKPGDKTSASWKIFENILNIFLSAWKLIEYSPFSEYCCYCSVTQSRPTLCDPMDRSMPGFPVLHRFPEPAQTHVHWVDDTIQPSGPLSITICNLKPSQKQSCPRELTSFSFFFFTVCDLIIKRLTCCPCKPWGPLGPTGPLKTNEKKSCIVFMTISSQLSKTLNLL